MCNSTLSLTSALDVVGSQLHPLTDLPGSHCIGIWVGPRAYLDGGENLNSTGIRSPDRPTRSESLYRLSYGGPNEDRE
jgi:hypothetical protein